MGLFFYPPHPISYILPLLLFFLSSHLSSDSLLFFSRCSCVYSSILTTILFFLSAFLHVFKRSFFYPTHIVPFLSLLFLSPAIHSNSAVWCLSPNPFYLLALLGAFISSPFFRLHFRLHLRIVFCNARHISRSLRSGRHPPFVRFCHIVCHLFALDKRPACSHGVIYSWNFHLVLSHGIGSSFHSAFLLCHRHWLCHRLVTWWHLTAFSYCVIYSQLLHVTSEQTCRFFFLSKLSRAANRSFPLTLTTLARNIAPYFATLNEDEKLKKYIHFPPWNFICAHGVNPMLKYIPSTKQLFHDPNYSQKGVFSPWSLNIKASRLI